MQEHYNWQRNAVALETLKIIDNIEGQAFASCTIHIHYRIGPYEAKNFQFNCLLAFVEVEEWYLISSEYLINGEGKTMVSFNF